MNSPRYRAEHTGTHSEVTNIQILGELGEHCNLHHCQLHIAAEALNVLKDQIPQRAIDSEVCILGLHVQSLSHGKQSWLHCSPWVHICADSPDQVQSVWELGQFGLWEWMSKLQHFRAQTRFLTSIFLISFVVRVANSPQVEGTHCCIVWIRVLYATYDCSTINMKCATWSKNTHQLSRHRSSAYLYMECYFLRPRQPFTSRTSGKTPFAYMQ